MSRSTKKGPYVDKNLIKKVTAGMGNKENPIKTWARNSQIPPEFVGHRFLVHNGRKFLEIFVSESMVGHRLGELVPTRTFRSHGKVTKRVLEKT